VSHYLHGAERETEREIVNKTRNEINITNITSGIFILRATIIFISISGKEQLHRQISRAAVDAEESERR
jgi:hypothetical protein